MTQDEVDLIYNYLHENYEYRDGNLIRIKKTCNGQAPVGHNMGYVFTPSNKGRPTLRTSFTVNKKRYCINVDRLIFIFHFKILPQVIVHIDNNPMNNKIENLNAATSYDVNNKNIEKFHGVKIYKGKNGDRYYPYLRKKGKKESTTFGAYSSYQEAHAAYLKAKEEYRETNA